jgi:hypothetical protein
MRSSSRDNWRNREFNFCPRRIAPACDRAAKEMLRVVDALRAHHRRPLKGFTSSLPRAPAISQLHSARRRRLRRPRGSLRSLRAGERTSVSLGHSGQRRSPNTRLGEDRLDLPDGLDRALDRAFGKLTNVATDVGDGSSSAARGRHGQGAYPASDILDRLHRRGQGVVSQLYDSTVRASAAPATS